MPRNQAGSWNGRTTWKVIGMSLSTRRQGLMTSLFFRLSKTMVRAVQWCLVVLSVSLLLTSNFFSWTSCSSLVSYIILSEDSWCGLCNYIDSYLSSLRLTSNIFFSMVHTNTLTNCPMLKRQIWFLHLAHFIIATTFTSASRASLIAFSCPWIYVVAIDCQLRPPLHVHYQFIWHFSARMKQVARGELETCRRIKSYRKMVEST